MFDIEVKGQGHKEFINVCETSYHGDTVMCQTKYDYVKRFLKKLRAELKSMS